MRNTAILSILLFTDGLSGAFHCMFRVNTPLSPKSGWLVWLKVNIFFFWWWCWFPRADSGLLSHRNTDNLCIFSSWDGHSFWTFTIVLHFVTGRMEVCSRVLDSRYLWTPPDCFLLDGAWVNSFILSGILTCLLFITFCSDWQSVFLLWMKSCQAVIKLLEVLISQSY